MEGQEAEVALLMGSARPSDDGLHHWRGTFVRIVLMLMTALTILLLGRTTLRKTPFPSSSSLSVTSKLFTSNFSSMPSLSSSFCLHHLPSMHASVCAAHYPHLDPLALPSPVRQRRYFIAVNFYNSDRILTHFLHELLRLVSVICDNDVVYKKRPESIPNAHREPHGRQEYMPKKSCSACKNTFISIYESGSIDHTRDTLIAFAQTLINLSIPHRIVVGGSLVKKQGLERIRHLSAVRNAAIEPMFLPEHDRIARYDKIIWLNDVLFCTEDVLRLINIAKDNVHMACGLDLYENTPIGFYDTWVHRGLEGGLPEDDWPWFHDPRSDAAMHARRPWSVFCCWNGLLVMDTNAWYDYGIAFRDSDRGPVSGPTCNASECSHICEDYWAIYGENTHIVVDPLVNVAYDHDVYEAIQQQPWFNAEERFRPWTDVDEYEFVCNELQPHPVPDTWYCRDLHFQYAHHRVRLWSEQEKHKRRLISHKWPGFQSISDVDQFQASAAT